MHQGALLAPTKAGGSGGVVADIAKLSVGREAYYTRELAENHEEYLSGHGESPGRWYGAGAGSLGLEGEASPAGFQAMFEGRHPMTGELLGRPHGRNAVPAFDVVLRPTKSVSILYGLGDAATGRAVLRAHHAGLAEAVAYLDEHLGVRRGQGQQDMAGSRRGDGLTDIERQQQRHAGSQQVAAPLVAFPHGGGRDQLGQTEQDQPDRDQPAMVQQGRQVAADQGDGAVAGVLAQLLGRQAGEGRLGVEAGNGQEHADDDLTRPEQRLIGHDGHAQGPAEPGPLDVRAAQAHLVAPAAPQDG
jgi:hypothetical protein